MLEIYKPKIEDLWFRELLLNDEETMSFNHAYGGTISFPKEKWNVWYQKWITESENCFYRYLKNSDTDEFIGEIAYHYDGERYLANIIVFSKYRGKGFGTEGLLLLCQCAKENGVKILCDDIAIDNPAISVFLKCDFKEEYRTKEIIMLTKKL